MLLRLFLLFTVVPLVELYVLIRLGGLIGVGPTILLVLVTGLVGAWLARREGTRSWTAVQRELAAGRIPTSELLHALLIVIAGVLLVTPGVFTDLAGILLLFRPVRGVVIGSLERRLAAGIASGGVRVFAGGMPWRNGFAGADPGFGPGTQGGDSEERIDRGTTEVFSRPAERADDSDTERRRRVIDL